jgi:putative endonuclease
MKRGFKVLDRNYLKKWGELDIVAKKDGNIHFVEVKSVSRELDPKNVIHETDGYRPEDNMHPWKLKRLARTIETYLLEKDWEGDWVFDVVTVFIDENKRIGRVKMIEDVVL